MSTDRWSMTAEAYVLGALDDADRAAFEAHLRGCAACRAAVDEVAALPAVLDQVPADLVQALSADAGLGAGVVPAREDVRRHDEPPAVLLRDLLRAAQREERRRRGRHAVVGTLVAAAVVATVLALPALGWPVPWRGAEPAGTVPMVATEAIELDPVAASSAQVTASVRLDAEAWGTRIDLVCRYEGYPADGRPYGGSRPAYALVLRDADGGTEEVATWSAVPGREVTVPASTLLQRTQIVEVELRSDDGTVLLSART